MKLLALLLLLILVFPPDSPAELGQSCPGTLSLDLQEMPLSDFFQIISEASGLNIVVDKDVFGSTTLKVREVNWRQLFELVLKMNLLGHYQDGNVLYVFPLTKTREYFS